MFYSNVDERLEYVHNKGLGLGILRNANYSQHIEIYSRTYNKNDVVFLFTDGLIESKNDQNHEYGYDRLLSEISGVIDLSPVQIVQSSVKKMYDFCGDVIPDDDITCLCLKFN